MMVINFSSAFDESEAPSMSQQATQVLESAAGGDRAAVDELMSVLYDEFRNLARSYFDEERPNHTLQPTAVVNEVYLKLINQANVNANSRTHFFAIGAQAMRRLLVDHARKKGRQKRGGDRLHVTLDESLTVSPGCDEDVLAINQALDHLAKVDPRQAQIVELRFFGGLTVEEVAEYLGVSKRTVESEWSVVRAWLRRELGGDPES